MQVVHCPVCNFNYCHFIEVLFYEIKNESLTGKITGINFEGTAFTSASESRLVLNQNYLLFRPRYVMERYYKCENGHEFCNSEFEHKGEIYNSSKVIGE